MKFTSQLFNKSSSFKAAMESLAEEVEQKDEAAPAVEPTAEVAAEVAPVDAPVEESAAEEASVTEEPAAEEAAPVEQDSQEAAEPASEEVVSEDSIGESEAERVEAEQIELAGEEISAVSEEAQEVQEEVNEAADTAVAMEALACVLERSLQTGGLDQSAAALFMGQVQEKFKSMNYPQVGIPAMEDADSPSARVGVASQALATVKKFISDIVKALMEGLAKLAASAAQIFKLVSDQRRQVISRAEKLRTILSERGVRTEAILSPRLLAKIAVGADAPKDMLKQVKQAWDVVWYFSNPMAYSKLRDVYANATKMVDAADKAEGERADLTGFNAQYEAITKDWSKKLNGQESVFNTNYTELTSYAAPGNRVFVCRVPKNLASSRELFGTVQTTGQTSNNSTGSVTPVTVDQAKALLTFVESSMSDLFNSEANETTKSLEKYIKSFTAAVARLNTDAKVESGAAAKVTRLLGFVTTLTGTSVRLPMYAFARGYVSICSGTLDLVAMSIASDGAIKGTSGAVVVAK